jgi:ABC-type uncharacterized transport system permease subunit
MTRAFAVLLPLLRAAVGLALAIGVAAAILQATGTPAGAALAALFTGATGLGGPTGFDPTLLAQSLARVTPLLLIGGAVALALRAGMFNIGAQGQMIFGALAAALIGGRVAAAGGGATGSAPLLVVVLLASGAAAGALWAALPAYLRVRRGVHEVITTIFFNYIAANVADYIVSYHFRDPASITIQTIAVPRSAFLPPLVPGTTLTVGLAIAVACTALYGWAVRATLWGFALRMAGAAPDTAEAAGITVARTQIGAMALSGALAGLAGALEVLSVDHRFLTGLAGSYGFDGIAVAFLGGTGVWGIAASALLLGGLLNGARYLQLQTNAPAAIGVVVQAVLIIGAAARLPFGWARGPKTARVPAAEAV